MGINFEDLLSIPEATEQDTANIQSRLETQIPAFVSDKETLAIFAFGGTVQSAYVPSDENIVPVAMNPALERMTELADRFGVANTEITGAILVAKDSRKISNADMIMLMHAVRTVANKKVLVSCGTYMLPTIARVFDHHFSGNKSDKIIGVTGSMLPVALESQDADLNIGGTVAAINAFALTKKDGTVFAQFHGNVYMGDELKELYLHRPKYNPRFSRPTVDVR